jgi:hypothetical protein
MERQTTAVQTLTTFDHGPVPQDFHRPRQVGVHWDDHPLETQYHPKVEEQKGRSDDHPVKEEPNLGGKEVLKARALMRPYLQTKTNNQTDLQ